MPTRRVKPTIGKEKMRAARTYEIWGGQVLAQKLDLQVFRGSRSGISMRRLEGGLLRRPKTLYGPIGVN
jgi:hypothetical protein